MRRAPSKLKCAPGIGPVQLSITGPPGCILVMPQRRRRSFTPQFKAQVAIEVLSGLKIQADVARQHKLKPELIARWKEIALDGLETLFQGGEQRDQDQDRIAELERMVGRLTMELEVAKKPRPCS